MARRREIFLHDQTTMKARAYEDGEKNTKKEIAKKLLNKGIDINIIIETTGLSEEEIKKIEN